MRNFFSYGLITIGAVIALVGFVVSAYIQMTNWQMNEWGILYNYPLEVLGSMVAFLVGGIMVNLGIETVR